MNSVVMLVFAASALFAWAMGSHYTGSVAGTVYGAGVLSERKAVVITAAFTVVAGVANSVNVIGTYANVVSQASMVDVAAAQLAAAIVTTCATY
jgi:phosphate/sulfate permease